MKEIKTVNDYIKNSAKESQSVMKELRDIIKATVPDAEERIAWNVPNYKLHSVLAGFAVYKKHVSLGFSEGGLSDKERKSFEAKGFKTGKATIQIKFDQEVPRKEIEQALISHAKLIREKFKNN